jgi:hypothetical protein
LTAVQATVSICLIIGRMTSTDARGPASRAFGSCLSICWRSLDRKAFDRCNLRTAAMKHARNRRIWLFLALAVPVTLLVADLSYGQRPGSRPAPGRPAPQPPRVSNPPIIRPAQPPGPAQQQAVWITVWSCSRCGQEIGRGNIQPSAATCPRCGASFQAFAPVAQQSPVTTSSDSGAGRVLVAAFIVLAGGGLVALVVVLIVWHVRRKPAYVLDDSERNKWTEDEGDRRNRRAGTDDEPRANPPPLPRDEATFSVRRD